MPATGIHHITAISSDAQANRDFWAGLLGLRAVKKTVNFDDPETYHLYYGDEVGSPGAILTFFPYAGARQGRVGRGMATAVVLAVPQASLDWWRSRLDEAGIVVTDIELHGDARLAFVDPDGLPVELVGVETDTTGWGGGTVPADHAILGVHSVTLAVPTADATRQVLHQLGYTGDGLRLTADAALGKYVDLVEVGSASAGVGGAGTIHHVAFRVGDDDDELAVRLKVVGMGLQPTPVIDRQYFHSVYFREPGGVLFELATDPPGFDADEPRESLGEALKLPPQYESNRAAIEKGVRPLLPATDGPVFVHRWEPAGNADRVLLALHGTGGDENDLIPLARQASPTASILSPRGRVDENGMPRFFRRLREGVFDEASIVREANALATWLSTQAGRYDFDASAVDAIGYSNGANIASAVLLLRPESLRSLVLLRPMIPLTPDPLPDLSGRRVLLLAGQRDPIAPPDHVEALATLLKSAGADVTTTYHPAGHELTQADVQAAGAFFSNSSTSS
ncbi:MAG: VOC family protein [Planctomycetota bacterium]